MENNDKMENLIMLLDDYEERIVGVHSVGDKINDKETAWIISKKFGFIEQLIKRNQIDFKKLHSEEWYYKLVIMCDFNTDLRYDVLLMILSIQDNPIEYLCKIIKEE